jgi:hypothetical protein
MTGTNWSNWSFQDAGCWTRMAARGNGQRKSDILYRAQIPWNLFKTFLCPVTGFWIYRRDVRNVSTSSHSNAYNLLSAFFSLSASNKENGEHLCPYVCLSSPKILNGFQLNLALAGLHFASQRSNICKPLAAPHWPFQLVRGSLIRYTHAPFPHNRNLISHSTLHNVCSWYNVVTELKKQ